MQYRISASFNSEAMKDGPVYLIHYLIFMLRRQILKFHDPRSESLRADNYVQFFREETLNARACRLITLNRANFKMSILGRGSLVF